MGVEFFPTFEDGKSVDMSGKALARAADVFDSVAKRFKVPNLYDFFSMGQDQMIAELLDGNPDDPTSYDASKLPPEHWHDAKDGLRTISALLEYMRIDGSGIDDRDAVLADLEAFRENLAHAVERGVRWHLSIYY